MQFALETDQLVNPVRTCSVLAYLSCQLCDQQLLDIILHSVQSLPGSMLPAW